MKSLALHGAVRRWLTRLHRWSGLVIMACMLVAAITGTWLTFRVEMDRLVNPELRVVHPGDRAVSLASIVDAAEKRFPSSMVQALILPERPDDSIGVYLQSRRADDREFDQVFFNPYDGAYLGGRSTSRLVFDRAHVDPMIDRLHYSLWMNSGGLWLMGIVAAVWLATSSSGSRSPGRICGCASWAGSRFSPRERIAVAITRTISFTVPRRVVPPRADHPGVHVALSESSAVHQAVRARAYRRSRSRRSGRRSPRCSDRLAGSSRRESEGAPARRPSEQHRKASRERPLLDPLSLAG